MSRTLMTHIVMDRIRNVMSSWKSVTRTSTGPGLFHSKATETNLSTENRSLQISLKVWIPCKSLTILMVRDYSSIQLSSTGGTQTLSWPISNFPRVSWKSGVQGWLLYESDLKNWLIDLAGPLMSMFHPLLTWYVLAKEISCLLLLVTLMVSRRLPSRCKPCKRTTLDGSINQGGAESFLWRNCRTSQTPT